MRGPVDGLGELRDDELQVVARDELVGVDGSTTRLSRIVLAVEATAMPMPVPLTRFDSTTFLVDEIRRPAPWAKLMTLPRTTLPLAMEIPSAVAPISEVITQDSTRQLAATTMPPPLFLLTVQFAIRAVLPTRMPTPELESASQSTIWTMNALTALVMPSPPFSLLTMRSILPESICVLMPLLDQPLTRPCG